MFRSLFFDSAMLLWAGIPILLAIGLFVVTLLLWRNKVKSGHKFVYPGEVFRNPINAALTVSGLFIPLLCGGIGYFIENSVPPRQLVPLLAATILFSLSVIVGLWNLFSMTTFKYEDDKIEIKLVEPWGFVAQFTTQLFIMFGGITVLLLYFLFFFEINPKEINAVTAPSTIMISRPALRAGISTSDLLKAWGAPSQVTNSSTAVCWIYNSAGSEFEFNIRSNSIYSIRETRK